MAYIVPIVIFMLAYNKQHSKIITAFILAYMWILVGLNTYTPDYAEYERVFFNPTRWNVEPGYRLLCDFFRGIGFNYQQFHMAFGALYVMLIYSGISRNTEYKNLVLALFLLWPFVPFVSGQRFAFAMAIFFNAVPYLYNKERLATIKYILIIGVACCFHMSAFVFFAYLFARRKYRTKQYLIAISLILLIVVAIRTGIMEKIAYKLNIGRLIKWLNMSSNDIGRLNIVGFTCYSAVLIANWFVASQVGAMALRAIYKRGLSLIDDKERLKERKYTIFLNINFLSLFIIPFYLISSEYQRYLNVILMMNYCMFAGFKKEQVYMDMRNKRIYCALFIFVIVLTASFYVYSQKGHDVIATLRDNYLFQH